MAQTRNTVPDGNSEPDEFMCPINLAIMQRPMMIVPCGHNADEKSINIWKQKKNSCPCCRGPIASLVFNRALNDAIKHFQASEIKSKELKKIQDENKQLTKLLQDAAGLDKKNDFHLPQDKKSISLLQSQTLIETSINQLTAKLQVAEIRRAYLQYKVKRVLKKIAAKIKENKETLTKKTLNNVKTHSDFQQSHLALIKSIHSDIKDTTDAKEAAKQNKAQFDLLMSSISRWSNASATHHAQETALQNENTLLNTIANRYMRHYAYKKFQFINQSITRLQSEIKIAKSEKVNIIRSSAQYAQQILSAPITLFSKQKDVKSEPKMSLPKDVQQALDKLITSINITTKEMYHLLHNGADPNIKSILDDKFFYCPPIYLAIFNMQIDTLNLLIQHHATVDCLFSIDWKTMGETREKTAFHNKNTTPLIYTVKMHHYHTNPLFATKAPEIINILLSHQADINFADAKGMTSLHWAAYLNDIKMVNLLLEKGANPNLGNQEGKTPLGIAREKHPTNNTLIATLQNAQSKANAP